MSFYAHLEGEINYDNQKNFDSVVNRLKEGGWIKGNRFVDECGEVIGWSDGDFEDIDEKNLIINIPNSCHRNLSRVDFFPAGATGWIVGASTDGCFKGWIIEDGNETDVDLNDWAMENIQEKEPEDFNESCEWRNMVIENFMSLYEGDRQSRSL